MKAINIEWDVDCAEDEDLLPSEIEIPKGMADDDEISDYLSDTTGFCHKGYELVDDMRECRIVRGGLSKQDELYEVLSCKTGQEVLDLIIEWYGMKILSDDFFKYLQNEGVIKPDEENEDETY